MNENPAPLRIMFIFNQYGVCRHYFPVLKGLAERGHALSLYFSNVKKKIPGMNFIEGEEILDSLEALGLNIQINRSPLLARADLWMPLIDRSRVFRSVLRYAFPEYQNAHKLRERLVTFLRKHRKYFYLSVLATFLFRKLSFISEGNIKLLDSVLKFVENLVPADKRIMHFFEDRKPQLVLLSTVVNVGCSQSDYLKACLQMKIPVGACIASWDNLTNKGVLQLTPDRVFVWNEFQRAECERYHDIPPERVIITGAQTFDVWFEHKPTLTREKVCERAGLATAGDYLVYACSSPFIAPKEVSFVLRWLQGVRESNNPLLKNINVIIRPHPQNAKQWSEVVISAGAEKTVVFPRSGQYVNSEEAKSNYFDLLYHCKAVVGINTSAMVEAGIFDKPVFTILGEGFSDTQEGTIHFSYLVDLGLAVKGNGLTEHITQLSETISHESESQKTIRRQFVQKFLRPRGLKENSTQVFIEEIERAAHEIRS